MWHSTVLGVTQQLMGGKICMGTADRSTGRSRRYVSTLYLTSNVCWYFCLNDECLKTTSTPKNVGYDHLWTGVAVTSIDVFQSGFVVNHPAAVRTSYKFYCLSGTSASLRCRYYAFSKLWGTNGKILSFHIYQNT